MKHIREFDGLRGLLALWVFASHAIELGPYPWFAAPIRPNLAVDIFIILSGFVIFHLLATGEDYRTFITRRWFRLFPVFAICFLAALVLYAWLGVDDETAFGIGHTKKLLPYLVTHAAMLHGVVPEPFLPHTARAILVPAWSISVEWQFYLLAPLLFALAMRPGWKSALVLAALVGLRGLHDVARSGVSFPGASLLVFDMQAFVPLKLEFFAVGAGSYAVWKWFSERTQPLHVPRLAWALALPLLLLVGKKSPAIALWLCVLLALTNVHFGTRTIVARGLSHFWNSSPAQFLGRLSYCIYLLHLPALVFVREIFRRNEPGLSGPALQIALVAGGLAATVAGSWLLHAAVEQPMIQLGKRLTNGWKIRYAPALGGKSTATP